ncbi:DNA polymerase III subunit delta' [Gudongella oleilytica]|jgi:DNA polymerase-3 subunit delta'|uniref:DNA polymerase III subunit delta' n=1 Tax=Gudongella oleilytica TaxID=1582259 RepID=UPI002A3683BC|nr:DNA polymerase III subunit delta' [Gudongella oleilytica]MDY0255927.1 DNA polymerase III subunit delta' [Gudongella oleilytica]
MDYTNISGHKIAVEGLKRAVKNGNISHFYIFEGEEGLGKMTIGRVFAKTLLCLQRGEEPCGSCSSCRRFETGSHPDYLEIRPEKGMIRKGEVEGIIHTMTMSPFESERKVILMDEAHLMNKEAQNALLKTLEEPPVYAHIILVTSSPKDLLPTIRSRGQNIRFYPLDRAAVKKILLEEYGADRYNADFLADYSKGSVGRAIKLLQDEEFFRDREWAITLIESLLKGEKQRIFSSSEEFAERKDRILQILDIFLLWFRDLLLYKASADSSLIVNRDRLKLISEQSALDFERINGIIEKIQNTIYNVQMNVNYQLSIETMLLKIQEEF